MEPPSKPRVQPHLYDYLPWFGTLLYPVAHGTALAAVCQRRRPAPRPLAPGLVARRSPGRANGRSVHRCVSSEGLSPHRAHRYHHTSPSPGAWPSPYRPSRIGDASRCCPIPKLSPGGQLCIRCADLVGLEDGVYALHSQTAFRRPIAGLCRTLIPRPPSGTSSLFTRGTAALLAPLSSVSSTRSSSRSHRLEVQVQEGAKAQQRPTALHARLASRRRPRQKSGRPPPRPRQVSQGWRRRSTPPRREGRPWTRSRK